ncbi:MAG: hypothetical protein COB98_01180 [Flavobacteriaceae bacterium]|nr:MAG: hypothetical protein COB98_01180 [Flavobacteriaceae bacterium]
MKTNEFIQQLAAHTNKELLFQYQENILVGANYHITEIKNTTFDTVDCGGTPNYWQETIVQLLENKNELDRKEYLSTDKALTIFKRVNAIKPLLMDAEIKFEYGNDSFHTSVMVVDSLTLINNQVLVKLAMVHTACKAEDVCGIPSSDVASDDSCCGPTGCC